jgi:hypothetical protein
MLLGAVIVRLDAHPRAGALPAQAQSEANRVPIDADDIGGVVTSSNGPEAGVWVIAETTDFKTKFRKIVVTNDRGQYLLPQLPKANYKIWVRGYGLVDSQPVESAPGTNLALTAVVAPTPKAAAQYYPPDYWYSMIKIPPKDAFPMKIPGEGPLRELGESRMIQTQADWIWGLRRGCGCHQMGIKATREIEPEFSNFPTTQDALVHKLLLGQGGRQQHNTGLGLANPTAMKMWTDWIDRIAKGELPPVPERPTGIERNLVLTLWDFGTRVSFPHDVIATQKQNPTVNANGKLYVVDWGDGAINIVDPVENADYSAKVPLRDEEWRKILPSAEPDVLPEYPSLYWGKDLKQVRVDPVNVGPGMMDSKGRVWFNVQTRLDVPAYCLEGSTNRFAEWEPMKPVPLKNMRNKDAGVAYFDSKTEQYTIMDTCYGASHTTFAYDKDETLFMTARGTLGVGWVNTRVWDQTHDEQKSQGWCPAVIDYNGDGKITKPWTKANEPPNPKLDRLATTHTGYILAVNPVDGTVWYHTTDVTPGDIVRVDLGKHPPETCIAEVYQPPFSVEEQTAFGPQGIDVDSKGLVWVSVVGSGQLASLDRSKCKVLNGPTATGQHCREGWTLYPAPGPKFQGTNVSADYHYNMWVDRFNTSGLGKDVPIVTGTGSDSFKAFIPETKQWITMRVPYPMGFYTRSLDGRIDNPKTGWKGRGLWGAVEPREVWLNEGGWGTRPYVAHFQMRPDPLAK